MNDDVKAILQVLKQHAKAAMQKNEEEDATEVFEVISAIQVWQATGKTGAMPLSQKWREKLNLSQSGTRAVPPPANPPSAVLPSAVDEVPTASSMLSSALEVPPVPAPAAVPVCDVDDELQPQFDAGIRALHTNEIKLAVQLLREVARRTRGRLVQPAQTAFSQAAERQQHDARAAVRAAQQVKTDTPSDLDAQRQAWRAVLAIADDGGEFARQAELAIAELEGTQQRATQERAAADTLAQLRRNITVAKSARQIGQLQHYVVQIEALRSAELSPALSDQVVELLITTTKELDALKREAGQVSTLLQSGNHEAAYLEARRLNDEGLTEVWDAALGRSQPIGEALRGAAQRLIEFRKGKAIERQERAKRARETSTPREVVALYREAVAYLTYLTLTTEERDGITYVVGGTDQLPWVVGGDIVERERADLQAELETSTVVLQLWNEGNRLFQEAERATAPEQALSLLRAAQAITARQPDLRYPGLDAAIQRREEDLSTTLTVQVENACTEAANVRNDFAAALARLTEARTQTAKVKQPSARLQTAIERLEATITRVHAQQRRYTEIATALDAAQAALASAPPDTEQAKSLLAVLTDDERRHPRVIELTRRIVGLQRESDNWALAQTAYKDGYWQGVVDACVQINGQHRAEATHLGGRARAMLALAGAQAALVALPPRYRAAHGAYTDVIALLEQHGTDAATQAALSEARQAAEQLPKLEKVQRDIESVQRYLAEASYALRQADYKRARSLINEALKIKERLISFIELSSEILAALRAAEELLKEVEDREFHEIIVPKWLPKIIDRLYLAGQIDTSELQGLSFSQQERVLKMSIETLHKLDLQYVEQGGALRFRDSTRFLELKQYWGDWLAFELSDHERALRLVNLLGTVIGLRPPAVIGDGRITSLCVFTSDISSVIEGLNIPNSLPILVTRSTMLNIDDVSNIRHILTDYLVPRSNIALLILAADQLGLKEAQYLLDNELRAYAIHVITLGFEDFCGIVLGRRPREDLRYRLVERYDPLVISPFVTSGPTSDTMFFGREQELHTIVTRVAKGSYVITGGRQMGKSSILNRLYRFRLPTEGFQAFHYNCSRLISVGAKHRQFLEAVAREWLPNQNDPPPSSFKEMLDRLRPVKSAVFLFDEADLLVPFDQAAGWPLFSELRALSHDGSCQFIFAGERILREAIQQGDSPLFNFADHMPLRRQ